MSILLAIARYLGFAGCCCVGLIIYYEGIPGAWRIPFLSNVPIIGDVATGKVRSFAAQQVSLATADMVTKFERDALAAQLAATERNLSEANRTAANARTRADETLRAKQAADARIDQLEREAAPNTKLSRPNEEDYRWTKEH